MFVVDRAIIPGALTINSMTITALAERVAYWMMHGKELAGSASAPVNH